MEISVNGRTIEVPDDTATLLDVLRDVVGDRSVSGSEQLVLLETNVDDTTGEILGHTIDQLLAAGALDAWVTPIVMKKSRPAQMVSVLAHPNDAATLSSILLAETGSIGCRRQLVERDATDRRVETVEIDGHAIRVKVTAHRCKAEHDDVVTAAAALDVPARELAARAEARWLDSQRDLP